MSKPCEKNCASFKELGAEECCVYCVDGQLEHQDCRTCDWCDCVMINDECAQKCREY